MSALFSASLSRDGKVAGLLTAVLQRQENDAKRMEKLNFFLIKFENTVTYWWPSAVTGEISNVGELSRKSDENTAHYYIINMMLVLTSMVARQMVSMGRVTKQVMASAMVRWYTR